MAERETRAPDGHQTEDGELSGLSGSDEADRLRNAARRVLGVEGEDAEAAPALREVLRESGASWYPLFALGILVMVDDFQRFSFFILGPEVARALGISRTTIAAAGALHGLAAAIAALCMAALVQNRPIRAAVALVAAIVWSITTIQVGFITGLTGLMIIMLADGATTGSVQAVHQPLLMDSYPPQARVRAFSYYRAANQVGQVIAPLMVFAMTAWLAFTWRGVFVGLGVVSLVAVVLAARLRDPGFGRWDTARLRQLLRSGSTQDAPSPIEERTQLGFFEITRRLLLIPTQRRILIAFAVLGLLIVPFQTFFAFYLDERWGMGPEARSLFSAYTAACSIVSLALFAKRGENLFRREPARLVRLVAALMAGMLTLISIGAMLPNFLLMSLCFGIAFALIATLLPAFYIALLSIVPANMRPHSAALAQIYLFGVGGVAGAILLGSVDRRFGIVGALVSIAIPGLIAAMILRSAARTIDDDLDRMIGEIVEQEQIRRATGRGQHLPLLACRGVSFSYGQLQVLFDVDFAVDDGEMVALLGVNGAGKSTLLRVVSGLGLPSNGSVRLRGADITFLDAERRVRLGISQISGGNAVFGPMTVVENLRLYGYTQRRSRRVVDRSMEVAFDAFPRLSQRRNQPASTLSGGEQQMLALTKALILEPDLLLIDELSLGLAPIVVGELLELVRIINGRGTAVVLVEQSVNIASSLVDHVYFMERGAIAFDGPADELLKRGDLLRSVFLGGATAGSDGSATLAEKRPPV